MQKAVIFIADPNPNGPGHKLILPTIRYMYMKAGVECKIIDPYKINYDVASLPNTGNNAHTKSYKHLLKTATEVHFITSAHLGGVSPMMEAIFEQVLTHGFVYDRIKNKRYKTISKKAFFYVLYNHDTFRWNSLYLRLKFIMLKQIFGSGKIFQLMPKDLSKLKSKGVTGLLNKGLKKHLQ